MPNYLNVYLQKYNLTLAQSIIYYIYTKKYKITNFIFFVESKIINIKQHPIQP